MARKPIIRTAGLGQGAVVATDAAFTANYELGVVLNSLVYITGTGTVALADASSTATMPARGVVSAIDYPAAGQALVVQQGEVPTFAGLTPGATYVASTTPGEILPEGSGDPAFPSASGEVIQTVGVALNATTLIVDAEPEMVLP